MVLIALAALLVCAVLMIPVILILTKKSNNDPTIVITPSKKPFDLTQITSEERNRINCFLEAESRFENLTQYQCEQVRSCTYQWSSYERVPDCFFKRDVLGYELVAAPVSTANTDTYYLRRSRLGNSTYLEVIDNLTLVVEYLSNNIVHVKVRFRFYVGHIFSL